MALQKLGPYRLERVLGQGGMGIVYAGVDERTGTRAAVKVLLGNLDDRPNLRLRFEAEIESLKRLRHANIVQLYAYGEEEGRLFYAMEMVDGRSLQDELKSGRIFSVPETLRIGLQIAIGLKLAHDSGIIHRDIKPANLLITREGLVKLTDFGIAKLFGASQVTADGGVVGTVDYMSPEQAEGKPVTHRSDLYAVGGVLYALLARVPPFGGRSVPQIIHALRFDTPPPLHLRAPRTPPDVEELIQKLLAKEPAERVPTALVLAKRLHELAKRYPLAGGPPTAMSAPPGPFPDPNRQADAKPPPGTEAPQADPKGRRDRPAEDSSEATQHEPPQQPAELTADERYASAEVRESLSTVELTWESQLNQLVPASDSLASPRDDGNLPLDPLSSDPLSSDPLSSDPPSSDPLGLDPLSSDPLGLDPLSSGPPSSPSITSAEAARTSAPRERGKPGAAARDATANPNVKKSRGVLPPTLDSRPSNQPSSNQPPPLLPPSVAPPSGMAAATRASAQGDARLSAASSRFTTVAEDERRRQLEQQREAQQDRSHFVLKTVSAIVVLGLLAGGAAYLSRPPSADSLYDELRLAASVDDDGSLAAVEPRIDLFLSIHPTDPRAAEVAGWKTKLDVAAEQRRFDRRFRRWDSAAAMGPIERLYGEAMQEAAARPDRALDQLRSLVNAYAAHPPDDASSQRSLKLAAGQLERLELIVQRQRVDELKLAQEQLRWADEQRAEAPEKAEAVYRGLAGLYAAKPWASQLMEQLKQRREPATPTAEAPRDGSVPLPPVPSSPGSREAPAVRSP
ncbi:MAG: protein kinase domain-containing protein [Planctomycetota bacterium]